MTRTADNALLHEPAGGAGMALEPARARFRGLIIQRIIAFEEFRKSVERRDGTSEALEEIAGLAHKISGVGATLGYIFAGAMAGDVEKAVLAGRARTVDPATIWSDVEPLLDALLDALEAILDD